MSCCSEQTAAVSGPLAEFEQFGDTETEFKLSHLLNSNTCPDDQDAITAMISAKDDIKKVEEILEKISWHMEQIDQLQSIGLSLAQRAQSYKAITHPLRRFPPELLTEIFHHCTALDYVEQDSLDVSRSPWLVSQVCRNWRNVAFLCPMLWASIRLSVRSVADDSGVTDNSVAPTTVLHRIRHQLIHSGTHPLTLYISVYTPKKMSWAEIASVLAPHASRFQDVTIRDNGRFLLSMKNHDLAEFPMLTKLSLSWSTSTSYPSLLDIFSVAPRLRTAHIYDQIPSSTGLPWSQLTELSVEIVLSEREIMHVVPLLINVTRLSLLGVIQQGDGPVLSNPIILPKVITLLVEDSDLLRMFTTPALETLELCIVDVEEAVDATNFLDRSSCPLRALKLDSYVDADSILSLLNAAAQVTELSLEDTEVDDIIGFFTARDGCGGPFKYLPRLEKLDFSLRFKPVFARPDSINALLEMIKMRSASAGIAGKLRFVEMLNVAEDGVWDQLMKERVRGLKDAGIHIIIRSSRRDMHGIHKEDVTL